MRVVGRLVGWLALYFGLLVLPLVLVYISARPPARGMLTELAVGLGFVGLALMGVQFYLTARFRRASPAVGADSIWQFHRQAGLVALPLIFAHPVLLLISDVGYLAYFDPRVNLLRAVSLVLALVMLLAIVGLSVWRERLGLSYEWWRLTHGVLAAGVLLIGLVHVLRVGHYVSTPWMQATWSVFCGAAILLLVHTRIVKPLRLRRRPYRVLEVRDEPGKVWTLVLAPDGHASRPFVAGQYAWLTVNDTPFTLQQHPFSISSSAEHPERLELTIKALGDFSSTIGTVKPGARAFLEGPYGDFTFEEPDARGAVFVVGGIGITPIMSMLRTLRDRRDARDFVLIYCNTDEDAIVFREELDDLAAALRLRIVHVLEDAPAGWQGETGLLTPELLDKHLPADAPSYHYYLCGPEPMMNVAERDLLARGLPIDKIHAERFELV